MNKKNSHLLDIASNFSVEEVARVSRFGWGLINDTFLVATLTGHIFVLQKLHPIFKPSVLEDMDAVTSYLSENKFITPKLVRTLSGELCLFVDGNCWRMLTYIPGRCFEGGINRSQAFSAAALVGRFHATLAGFDYEFKHRIKGFRNTPLKMRQLKKTLLKFNGTEKYAVLNPIAQQVLNFFGAIDRKIIFLPDRVIHGDLKINNIRFDGRGRRAVSLIDLDTLARNKAILDFGDAARTWCNKSREGDYQNSAFSLHNFRAMLAGYLSKAKDFITKDEILAIPEAIETIILEITSRFIVDAFEESYFRLDEKRYNSLYEQNRDRALAQIKLYKDFFSKKRRVVEIIKSFLD